VREIGRYSGLNRLSYPEGTSSGYNGIETSATLYPFGNLRSKGDGDSGGVAICSIGGVAGGVGKGGVSLMIAGGYRVRSRLTEGVMEPRLDKRAGSGEVRGAMEGRMADDGR